MEAHSCQLCICFILFYQGLGGQLDYFGLWIDNSFNHGHSKAVPKCTTYGSPQLSGQTQFEVEALEVWAVGPEKKNRLSYADDDDAEVSKLIVFHGSQYQVPHLLYVSFGTCLAYLLYDTIYMKCPR